MKRPFRTAVGALAFASATGLACGRTALNDRSFDGVVRGDASLRPLDAIDGGRGAPDSGLASSDALSSFHAETSHTSPTCTPGRNQPTSLAIFDQYSEVDDLASSGGRVFTCVQSLGSTPPPGGLVASVSVATGEMMYIDISNYLPLGVLAHPGGVLIAAGRPISTSTSWSASPSDVYRLDFPTQTVSRLANPAGLSSPRVGSWAANGNGDVFWVLEEAGANRDIVARWDPSTGSTSTVLESDHLIAGLLADARALYWKSTNADGHAVILSAPLGGGPITNLFEAATGSPTLTGQDDENLYCFGLGGTPGIMALPKAGGASRTIVTDISPFRVEVDGSHVYWWTLANQHILLRAPKAGGPTETLWSNDQGRFVAAMTLDECNVYWLVANPFEIYFRAK